MKQLVFFNPNISMLDIVLKMIKNVSDLLILQRAFKVHKEKHGVRV